MAKKMKRSATDEESSSSSASSSDDISREEAARHRRRRSQARKNAINKKERSYSQRKEIINFLAEIKEEVCKQSKQVTESKEKMYKQLEKLREEMCQQSKQATESKEEICKQLEKVKQDINQEMHKQFTEIITDLRKQWDLHTNASSGDDSDAPRSQSNEVVQPPRYRLVFKSSVTDRIEKGQIIDISVALVDGSNDQTVESGPLASATVELVVINAEFNQHNNQYNWSREDFESNIKKARGKNSATGDVDQSVKSIVSNGQFNLVHGARCHSGSTIFSNSSNKKVRLGVMVVSPTEERVLEGLSDPFYVRGHDRPARQNNFRNNRLNTQREALDCNRYQEQSGPMPNMQNPSWPNPIHAGGRTRQTLVDNSYQVQNGQIPNLQNSLLPNSTQTEEIRFNTTTSPQLPFPGDTTMPPSGFNINEQQQLPFIGNTSMLSAEPSTSSQEQRASTQYHHFPHLPTMAQATNNQIDELLPSALVGHLRNPNYMGNSHVPIDEVCGMQFIMDQRVLPVQLLWDRSNVEPSKRRWNLFDKLNTSPQEHFGSLSSPASIQKSVLHTCQRSGVLIEALEPDDSDEERPLRIRRQSKYQLRFVNKVCKAYYTRDQIKAHDGSVVKVAVFDENNTKITSGPLSSASVEVVALHGDFNVDGQDYWTSEEFNRSVVCLCPLPGEEASSIIGGDRILVLADGEACLSDAFFQITSFAARTGKFKMGVMLASVQDERVQEGISEPFRVIDNRVKELHAKDGPNQGFNPAAATLQVPRNTVTKAIDYWTSEEFSRSVVCPPPGEEASSVLGGDRTLVLAGGEACVGDAFSQRTSFCARTAKFKMGVRLLPSAQKATIQEGISEPFPVTIRHVKELYGIDGATTHKTKLDQRVLCKIYRMPKLPVQSTYEQMPRLGQQLPEPESLNFSPRAPGTGGLYPPLPLGCDTHPAATPSHCPRNRKAITDGQGPPLAQHLKKSDTWDTRPGRRPSGGGGSGEVDLAAVAPVGAMRKADTFGGGAGTAGEEKKTAGSRSMGYAQTVKAAAAAAAALLTAVGVRFLGPAAAAGAALRLRLLYRMLLVGVLLALVAVLSWPSAAAAALRLAGSLLLNARFLFVLGNAIVLHLLAPSRHVPSASSSSSSGQQTSTTAAASPPQDALPAAASASASFSSSFTGTPIAPLPPAASLEAFSTPPPAPATEAAAAPAPADAGTAFEFDDRPVPAAAVARVSKLARAPRRSRSEKMGLRVLQRRRAASPPPAAPDLRRSESENGRRRSSVSARDVRGCSWGADFDADEFRRTVEAFIDKHKRFHRQESMTTIAVVAESGSGHCEPDPAFTGAFAVVK